MASPNEIMKTWPTYKVAAQKAVDEPVQIRDVKCPNITELYDFLKRIYVVSAMSELAFLEIHELLPQGRIALVHECNKPWPKKVKEIKVPGILAPRIPREEGVVDKTVETLASQAAVVVAGVSGPDEVGRPTIPYKIEVA